MAQDVDSAALSWVAKALRLSTHGSQRTIFIDERLEQTLDIGPLVRRGLTHGAAEGLYSANIRNTHSGAEGNVATVVDPWELGIAAKQPFPTPIPAVLDLWLIGFNAINVSTPAVFDSAFFDLAMPVVAQAFGTATTNVTVAGWGGEKTLAGTVHLIVHSNSPQLIFTRPAIRVPRAATFRFHTRNVGATAPVYQLNMLLGLFPAALGQDAVG